MSDYPAFAKVPRYSRDIIISEKLDGSNALVSIDEYGTIRAGSRTRWITPDDDNYGFARWVDGNKSDLAVLGPGLHFGEWWGNGIQRGYGLKEKRFSLFNTSRWVGVVLPNIHVVPVLYSGSHDSQIIQATVNSLELHGSVAAPQFMKPEGIMIYHEAARHYFKKTIDKDHEPKGLAA